MKTLKNITVIILMVFSTVITAQQNEVQDEFEQYYTKLNLTEEQKMSYREITKQYEEQYRFIKESGLSKTEKVKEIQKLKLQKDSEMEGLLTNEQFKEYKSLNTELRKTSKGNYSEEFSKYLDRLDLSQDQEPKFIEISIRYREQFETLRNSSKSRLGKYRAFTEIQKNKNGEMKSLLSPNQYEVYLNVQKEVQKKMMENRNK
ncbi:hypothetical protein L0P88_19915 [Muricauda sp. SCSIO 64092]|uniref:hypothetical protein n=1 Tax=Allomuricauda sp. SCSIO 64092 TaxID=2908842 RepID=UPI001FF0F49D|nr:hypothetical protein [Muricauda sp. SCSIO 64092]UOY06178.1 hypothetical protein L0P88_19915 [Muricauda sp. SCSIO 64092]